MGLDFRGWIKLVATVGAAVCGTLAAGGTPQAAALAGLVTMFAFIDKTIAGPVVVTGSSFAPQVTAEQMKQAVAQAVAPVAQQAADAASAAVTMALPMVDDVRDSVADAMAPHTDAMQAVVESLKLMQQRQVAQSIAAAQSVLGDAPVEDAPAPNSSALVMQSFGDGTIPSYPIALVPRVDVDPEAAP